MNEQRRRTVGARSRRRRLPPAEHLLGLPTAQEAAPLLAQGLTDLAQGMLTWLVSRPRFEWMLERLFSHPRRLQVAAVLLGLVLVILSLYPLLAPSPRPVALPGSGSALSSQVAPATGLVEQEVLVAAYNQASITAAVLNRPDAMAPYLAPDGAAWAAVQAEYQRRATRGETHDPALTRWGVLRLAVNSDTATVETQEQWDDISSIGGQVVSSRRGVLTRNSYTLRRSPSQGAWLITSVTSTTLMN